MKTPIRRLNNSFVHGAAAYAALTYSPYLYSQLGWIVAGTICVYAGWCRQAYLASFLGGVIVAVAVLTAVGILMSPEVGFGMFFMVPFALTVILPTVLAGYIVGKVLAAIARRRAG